MGVSLSGPEPGAGVEVRWSLAGYHTLGRRETGAEARKKKRILGVFSLRDVKEVGSPNEKTPPKSEQRK